MEITVKTLIVNAPDCWNGGEFKTCQYLGRAYREKTKSQYFHCELFRVFLTSSSNEGSPIQPCVACMDARG